MELFDRRPICNNNPESAPVINGKPFVLCWRCCGAVTGLLFLLSVYKIHRFDVNAAVTTMLMLPAAVDWLLIRLRWKSGNNAVRFVTGILLGIAFGMFELLIIRIF